MAHSNDDNELGDPIPYEQLERADDAALADLLDRLHTHGFALLRFPPSAAAEVAATAGPNPAGQVGGKGGDVLCCDTWRLVFHLCCYVPTLARVPDGAWSCAHGVLEGTVEGDREAAAASGPSASVGNGSF